SEIGRLHDAALLVPPEDPGALREALRALVNDPEAREALGGRAALDRVARLEFTHDGERTRILFPDRYRIDSAHGRTLFDGTRIVAYASDGTVASDSATRANADVIRRRGRMNLATYAIQYLLRALPGNGGVVKICTHAFDTNNSACLAFSIGAAQPVIVLIDRLSGRPLGFATRFTGVGEPDGYWLRELRDYRRVQAVWLPHAIRSKRFNLDGTLRRELAGLTYDVVRVNPPAEPGDGAGGRR
ncbi:MAG: hypothetical protein M3R55_12015, partial [Acidobacteriota bacterium]|nr:hypothetical protein [Acidobacteriota bacterium]